MWKTELKGDSDQDFILQSIQHGFSLIDSDHCIANIPTTEMPNHRSAINSHQMHRVEEQITSEVHEGNYRPIHNKPCIISIPPVTINHPHNIPHSSLENHNLLPLYIVVVLLLVVY